MTHADTIEDQWAEFRLAAEQTLEVAAATLYSQARAAGVPLAAESIDAALDAALDTLPPAGDHVDAASPDAVRRALLGDLLTRPETGDDPIVCAFLDGMSVGLDSAGAKGGDQ
jgi:hypothetical protein